MTVTNDKNDYTMEFDFVLADDTEFKGKYKGNFDEFGQYRSYVSSQCKQAEINDAAPGEFYLKLNDENWKYEMVLDFFVEPGATAIPAGTYNLSEDLTAPCYGPKSAIDFYSPLNETVKVTGPITVALDGLKTSIEFLATDEEGLIFDIKYNGEIEYNGGAPVEEVIKYPAVTTDVFGKAATLTFAADNQPTLVMDVYTGVANYLKARTYEVGVKSEANEGYFIDSDARWTYVEKNGDKVGVKSGTMTVTNDKNDYTMEFDFVLADDTEFKGEYKGNFDAFGQYRSYVSSQCKQVEINDAVPGEFYLKLNDENWKYEMVLDFFMESGGTAIPAGTYNLSEDLTAPCYGPKSAIDFYSPINETVKVTGPVTVEVDGKNTSISFEAVGSDGMVFDMKYNGEIEYLEPVPPVVETLDYTVCSPNVYSKAATLTFSGEGLPTLALDLYTGNASYLKAGSYMVESNKQANGGYIIDPDIRWTFVEKNGDKIALKSGEMRVSNERNDFTLEFDFILDDDSEFKGTYKGEIAGLEQYRTYESSLCTQNEVNNPVPGEIYLKLNDAVWTYEMTLDFFLEPGATVLTPGIYNLNEETVAPCYGPRSSIDFYSPINETVKVTGPVTVAVDGNNTSISFEAVDDEGMVFDMKYNGEIQYLQSAE